MTATVETARADESGCSLSESAIKSAECSTEASKSGIHPEQPGRSLTQEKSLLRMYSRNQTRDDEPFTGWIVMLTHGVED